MKKVKISGDDLKKLGYSEGKVIGVALRVIENELQNTKKKELLSTLKQVMHNPERFVEDEKLKEIAIELIAQSKENEEAAIPLKDVGDDFAIYGKENIEQGAISQMLTAMRLPVTLAGALMPDAHQGYGLPIGGVLATNNVVIPYGVGVDIGCRMALSIYDIPANHLLENESKYKRELIAWTKFGAGAEWQGKMRVQHEVLERPEFNLNPLIKGLHEKAYHQLGTSGGGNHFVEFGIIEFENDDVELNIKKGSYVALLSHSGSRGFGAMVANHYTKLAKEICKLPKEAANLAYLDLNSAEGQEYWLAMNLAGDYASACHEIIHDRLAKAMGGQVLAKVENHHNFAWKEELNGQQVIVHRKGATPASKGVMGIIPGSMTASGFLVRGKGEVISINSASHGAGRQMSRTQAMKSITVGGMKKILKEYGVTLVGGGLDEAPIAYKNIDLVMESQRELVSIVAKFTPKLVRMADDGSRED